MKNNNSQNAQQDVRKRVVVFATDAFQKEGIKEVTMDGIARGLHMSKRTLYQVFYDKEELVKACIEHCKEIAKEHYERINTESSNALEAILLNVEFRMNELKSCCERYFSDMIRYPRILDYLQSRHSEDVEMACKLMERGVEEGYFRHDINFRIFHKALFDQFAHLLHCHSFAGISVEEAFYHFALIPLRGCATPKGIEFFDRFLEKHQTKTSRGK